MALTQQDIIMMTDADEQRIKDATSMWEEAKARGDTKGMEIAHTMAENIRAAYGYSGGSWGSDYIPVPVTAKPEQASKDIIVYDYSGELVKQFQEANTTTKNVTEVQNVDPAYANNQVPIGYSNLVGSGENISIPVDIKKYGMYAGGLIVVALAVNLLRRR
jgi:hypothetical protein